MVVRAARVLLNLGRLVWFSSFIEQCDFPFLTVSTPRGGPHSPAGRQHERRREPFISLQRTELFQGRKEVARIRGEDEAVIEHNLLREQVLENIILHLIANLYSETDVKRQGGIF